MKSIQRFFLIVEGQKDGYPNYESAKIHFQEKDPAEVHFKNLFICSPLFSVLPQGYHNIPKLADGTKITFIMVPNIFPAFNILINHVNFENEIWFSLGLANLVIIENQIRSGITSKVLQLLRNDTNITAYETWHLKDEKISTENKRETQIEHTEKEVENINIKVSSKLPLHIKFGVSEYIISINKFLTASKKFTPHYYNKHLNTIESSKGLINDLSFLFGDKSFTPTKALLNSLKANSATEATNILKNKAVKKTLLDLINDRNGRLIQFNSAMSYVYSQAYSGTFPIFDHIGIVRRHSLLGLGSAIGALFELVSQIEISLFYLPFENKDYSIFQNTLPTLDYLDFLIAPSLFNPSIWSNDSSLIALKHSFDPLNCNCELPSDFFNRLSFFSGRLGFREYDLSATAAIQVLVEGNSLQWHVINYTHEIIHNHVRLILQNLITPPLSLRNSTDEIFLKYYIDLLKKEYKKNTRIKINYYDYFILILINFSIHSKYHGSLSKESIIEKVIKDHSGSNMLYYRIPAPKELRELILDVYKDISEIFVHIIDYTYIYKRNINTYVQSIWTSWSTVISVAMDLKQYILRTLLVISISEEGKAPDRYVICKNKFINLMKHISTTNKNFHLYDKIKIILNDTSEDDDLRIRFYNCLIISDLVNHFFIGRLEGILDNEDANRLLPDNVDESGNPVSYDIETNSFDGNNIKSKVRFLLDQLLRACYNSGNNKNDSLKEKTSAWLLLSLSTINHKP